MNDQILLRIALALESLLEVSCDWIAHQKAEDAKREAERQEVKEFRARITSHVDTSEKHAEQVVKNQSEVVDVMKQAIPPPEPWERGASEED